MSKYHGTSAIEPNIQTRTTTIAQLFCEWTSFGLKVLFEHVICIYISDLLVMLVVAGYVYCVCGYCLVQLVVHYIGVLRLKSLAPYSGLFAAVQGY